MLLDKLQQLASRLLAEVLGETGGEIRLGMSASAATGQFIHGAYSRDLIAFRTMAVPQNIQSLLQSSKFDAVEDAWLTRLGENAADIAFFKDVGKALNKAGESERARTLLDMVDSELSGNGAWQDRLELLRHTGHLFVKQGKLHPAILSTLKKIYGEQPSFEELVEKMGLRKAVDDIPKTWKKVERLVSLLNFDVGSAVILEGQGAGRVVEVNMTLESFKVDLADGDEIRVGFGGVAKLLKPLPDKHILRSKMEDPEGLAQLKPPALLQMVLESYDEPRTGAEVRKDIVGLVPENKWSSWWSAARKHPQVISSGGSRRAYAWAASSDHAQDAVWESFEGADVRARLKLLRQNASRDDDLRGRMSELLIQQAEAAVEDDPGLALEVFFGLKKYGNLPEGISWTPDNLAVQVTDKQFLKMTAGMKERPQREQIYKIAAKRRQGYGEFAMQLLMQEKDARALDTLSKTLAPEALNSFLEQLMSQPRKSPAAFTWFMERAADRPEWLQRNPMRFLKQYFSALSNDLFGPLRLRLQPLSESGGTVPKLLALLDEEQAGQAAEVIGNTPALQEYEREPLLNSLYLRYPSLRQTEAPLYATQESIEEKREELRRLVEEEMPANRRAIEEAREMGDLRENFEYKSARDRHEYLSSIASNLDRDLNRVRPIDTSIVDGTEVVIGSKTRFVAGDGSERNITILGPWNSLPEEDVLSNESDLAKALMGTKLGEEVEIAGKTFEVKSIVPAF